VQISVPEATEISRNPRGIPEPTVLSWNLRGTYRNPRYIPEATEISRNLRGIPEPTVHTGSYGDLPEPTVHTGTHGTYRKLRRSPGIYGVPEPTETYWKPMGYTGIYGMHCSKRNLPIVYVGSGRRDHCYGWFWLDAIHKPTVLIGSEVANLSFSAFILLPSTESGNKRMSVVYPNLRSISAHGCESTFKALFPAATLTVGVYTNPRDVTKL
jgi:hypothetical protein